MTKRTRGGEKLKTYRERAEYLSSIQPMRRDIYEAIAVFFGEDEIPPKFAPKSKLKVNL